MVCFDFQFRTNSPVGGHICIGHFLEGVMRVYTLLLEDTMALARARLTRWWRPEECQQYLHVDEYPTEQ